jgi:hypothetical protein
MRTASAADSLAFFLMLLIALASTSTASARYRNYCSQRPCPNGGMCVCHKEGADISCYTHCYPPRSKQSSQSSPPTSGHHPIQSRPTPSGTRKR